MTASRLVAPFKSASTLKLALAICLASPLGIYGGLHLLMPVSGAAAAWWIGRKTLPAPKHPVIPAVAVLTGHGLLLAVELLTTGTLDTRALEVLYSLLGIVGLVRKPGAGPIYFLALLQIIGLAMSGFAFADARVAAESHEALFFHVLFRALSLYFLGQLWLRLRKGSRTAFRRITTDHWTILLPDDWIDRSERQDTKYFEAPAGDRGLYISFWLGSDREVQGSRELIEKFQSIETRALMRTISDAGNRWDLIDRTADGDEQRAVGYWEGIDAKGKYWVAGKQLAAGKYVLKATFHDYDSKGPKASAERFSPIIESLELRIA